MLLFFISTTQEAADQLELQMENQQCCEVKRKLSLLSQKLRILINVCHVYSSRLATTLGKAPLESVSEDAGENLGRDESGSQIMPTLSNEVSLFSFPI